MKRHVAWLVLAAAAALPTACGRDDVTGVPGVSASRSTDPAALRNVIIFSTLESGRSGLAVMAPDGSGRRRLTNDDRGYIYAAISPDGRRVVFDRFTSDDQPEGIFLMNADGSGQTLLVHRSTFFDGEPAWSPDGRQIAFTSWIDGPFGPFGRIFLINVDGTGLRQLTPDVDPNDYQFDGGASWSPDGRRIVFTRSGLLHVINVDGTGFTPLPNEDFAENPAWSPDGLHIAYQALDAPGDIRMRDPDGSNPVTISNVPQQQGWPRWSPDSRRIVFNRVIGGQFRLLVINIDGTGETQLSLETSDDLPYWSPFPPARSGAGASIEIAPTNAKLAPTETQQFTATVRTTTGSVLPKAPVTWSSSDAAVATVSQTGMVTAADNGTAQIQAVFGGDTARAELRVVDHVLRNSIVYATDAFPPLAEFAVVRPDGSGRRRLTSDQFGYRAPDISPDGRQIAFATNFAIFTIRADAAGVSEGYTLVFFGFSGELPDNPAWSPDGSQIAFSANVEGSFGAVRRILVVNVDGSNLRQVSPDDPASDDGPTWSPDATRLIFTRGGVLQVSNADGTGLRSLGNDDVASLPDWSPDGTRVAYGTSNGVRVRNVDGSNLLAVTSGQDNHPRWAPDNGRLVFSRIVAGKSQLFVVSADGSGETRLTVGTANESDPSWSPLP